MDEGARLWLVKTAKKHYWRVAHWIELEDLIQEGYAAYYRTCAKYSKVTDVRNHMALFKRVFNNRLHDLANRRTRSVVEVCFDDLALASTEGQISMLEVFPSERALEEVRVDLIKAPQYVRDALVLLDERPGRLRSRYRKSRPGGRGIHRETLNERLCRLTGYDPETDIVGGIKRALGVVEVTYYRVQKSVVVERAGGRAREIRRVGGIVARA